jgi:CubicO group peptidase (beta-lactamase class C family)
VRGETMMRSRAAAAALLAFGFPAALTAAGPAPGPPSLASALTEIRARYDLPALAGAIVTTDGLAEEAAVGVRKRGTRVPVTLADVWSLGSDTKAMTAFLVGTFVAEGKLKWSSPVVSFFPEIAARVPAANRGITVGDVLSHEAGLRDDYDEWIAQARHGSLAAQRRAIARSTLLAPGAPPGTFYYANNDYVLVAALLERLTGRPWEDLMTTRVFRPLHMDSAGFYRAAHPGQVDEPWPHEQDGEPLAPTDFAAQANPVLGAVELPPFLAPAGLIHCTLADWAKFLADQLRGAAGRSALLPAPIYRAMQTPKPGMPYGFGWGVADRPWAAGSMLEHEGSDQLNYCICALAPRKGFGVLVCTNQGGPGAAHACSDVVTLLVQRQLASADARDGLTHGSEH